MPTRTASPWCGPTSIGRCPPKTDNVGSYRLCRTMAAEMPPFVVCRPFVAGIDMCFSRFASKMMVSLFQLFADVLHCALPWDSLQTAVGSVCCGAESAGTFSAQPEMDTRRISEEVSPAAFFDHRFPLPFNPFSSQAIFFPRFSMLARPSLSFSTSPGIWPYAIFQ